MDYRAFPKTREFQPMQRPVYGLNIGFRAEGLGLLAHLVGSRGSSLGFRI